MIQRAQAGGAMTFVVTSSGLAPLNTPAPAGPEPGDFDEAEEF
jgi:hypothetical protein